MILKLSHLAVYFILLSGLLFCQAIAGTTRFAVLGDFGDAVPGSGRPLSRIQCVADMIGSWNPDCIVTVGDNFYEYVWASVGNPPSAAVINYMDRDIGQYYRQFMGSYAGVFGAGSSSNRLFFCPGNHDWGNTVLDSTALSGYLSFLTLPGSGIAVGPTSSLNERYYDFIQGNVHFFILSSDDSENLSGLGGTTSTSTQGTWLMNALSQSKVTYPQKWRVVLMHHPPFTSEYGGQRPNMRWPFRQWGADIVFMGHSHDYERLKFDGINYVVEGTGGESLGSLSAPFSSQSVARDSGDQGATLVEATDTALTMTHYYAGVMQPAQTRDTVTIVKNSVDGVLDRIVEMGTDDAIQDVSGGGMTTGGLTLDIVVNSSAQCDTGLRFTDVKIPPQATITAAFVQFKASANSSGSGTSVLSIKGHKATDASTFGTTLPARDVSSRYTTDPTTASATWSIPTAWTVEYADTLQKTADLSPIIQEIVAQPGWASGNHLALVLRCTTKGATRQAYAFEGVKADNKMINRQSGPAILHVEWVNPRPLVSAGARDADASEADANDKASFIISRTGPTTSSLTVNYTLSGTAGAQDYTVISPATATSATILAGASFVVVNIQAAADSAIEVPEGLMLQLATSANYDFGLNSSATIYLHDIRAPSVFGTAGSARTTLTWDAVPGATDYQVRRSTMSGSGYGAPTIVNGLSYTDTTVADNTAYYYVVTARKGAVESIYSREVDLYPVSVPQNVTVTGTSSKSLAWTAVPGAEFYHVMRGTASGSYTTNFRTSASPFTDATSLGYYYAVSAVKKNSESQLSAEVLGSGNHAPLLMTTPWQLIYISGTQVIDPGLNLTDFENNNIQSATIRIIGNFKSGQDVLDATVPGGVTKTPSGDTLTLSGSASLSTYQTILRSATYQNSSANPDRSTRTIRFLAVDSLGATSDIATRQIGLRTGNTTPALTSMATLLGGSQNTPYPITYTKLKAASNAADANADTVLFRLESVEPGTTLTKNGTAVTPGVTLLAPGESVVWTPALNTSGPMLNAFTVKVSDGAAVSASAVQVKVAVANPFVTIIASDAVVIDPNIDGASGGCCGAMFNLTRYGDVSQEILVNCAISGTASPGVDYYPSVPNSVYFGPGATSASIVVDVFYNNLFEVNETLILSLIGGTGYTVGTPSVATVWFDKMANLLPLSGDTLTAAYAVNYSGTIVGSSSTPALSRAVFWTLPDNQSWHDLAGAPLTVPAALVNGIVASGIGTTKIVGWGLNAQGTMEGFVTDGTVGGAIQLPSLGFPGWKAIAINSNDLVAVGMAKVNANDWHACVWDLSGPTPVIYDLDTLGTSSVANDASELENLPYVGESSGPFGTLPTVWDYGFIDQLFMPEGDDNGSAQGMNNQQTIVGYTWSSTGGPYHAVRWDYPSSVIGTLLPLPANVPATASTYALKINNTGFPAQFEIIVGYAYDTSFTGPSTRAVVWYGGNGYLLDDLVPVPNAHYTIASGTNEKCDVVGQIVFDNGAVQAFSIRP